MSKLTLKLTGTLTEVGSTRDGASIVLDVHAASLWDGDALQEASSIPEPRPSTTIPVTKTMARALGPYLYKFLTVEITPVKQGTDLAPKGDEEKHHDE